MLRPSKPRDPTGGAGEVGSQEQAEVIPACSTARLSKHPLADWLNEHEPLTFGVVGLAPSDPQSLGSRHLLVVCGHW